MNNNTEEYCQHPHVNERLRKEVAELRKENERLKHNYSSVSDDNMDLDNRVSQQAETIKSYKEAIELYLPDEYYEEMRKKIFDYVAKSALSGTKETE